MFHLIKSIKINQTQIKKKFYLSSNFLRNLDQTRVTSNCISKSNSSSSSSSKFKDQLIQKIRKLRYSYFAAIGGSKDGPPPNLSAEQVSQILRTNQFSINPNYEPIKRIECNQLASNSPIEDRLRVSKLQFNSFNSNQQSTNNNNNNSSTNSTNKKPFIKDTLLFAVFDGHGGEICADLVADRLFSYLAVSLFNLKSNQKLIEPISLDYLNNLPIDKFKQIKKRVLLDQVVQPKLFNADYLSYRSQHLDSIEELILIEEKDNLVRFAKELELNPIQSIEDAIQRSFKQCDLDLSNEIQRNLSKTNSNIAIHYYLSLAASGCCVNLILIDNELGFVASTGDCKAIQCITDNELNIDSSKLTHLSIEHDSDNINEIRRLMSNHPKEEHNTILKNNRLLGRLMPLRAFGDFSYKWKREEMQKYLTRAFGPHIIPPNYHTPPYLIVDPEITKFTLASNEANEESFIILATDGLWEQFANVRQITKTVLKHKLKSLRNESESNFYDLNSSTYLLRNALGQTHLKNYDPHILTEEIIRQQHERLVSFLTLPQSVVRNFRDDISVIVIHF